MPACAWRGGASRVHPFAKFGERETEAFGNADEAKEAGVADPALDAADEGRIKVGALGEALLGEAFGLPLAADGEAESGETAVAAGHARHRARAWTISQWTMSQVGPHPPSASRS